MGDVVTDVFSQWIRVYSIHVRCLCSAGLDVVEPRLKKVSEDRWHDRLARRCVIGVNIGRCE